MTRHILSAFALMTLLLSCQREEEPRTAKNIAFSIDEVTRATIINSKTDYVALSNNSLVVAAYQGSKLIIPEQDVTYSSTTQQWSTSANYPWPTDASDAMKTMTFYSWTPLADGQGEVTLTQSSGSASFDYEAQTEASKQKDIMFGYYSGVSATGVAPLTFKHALAAVKFKVGSIASGCTVDDVCITGIADNGTCSVTFPGTFSWNIDGATKTKSYHPEDTDANPGYGVLSEGSQIGKNAITLVPQSMTSTAKITFKITPSGGSQETYDISLASSVDLKAGYVTTYKINMAKNVSFDVTVTPWDETTEHETEFEEVDHLSGIFSISDTKKVYFSKGNLQATYHSSTSSYTWGFAEQQHAYIGNAAGNTTIDSQTDEAVVDTFGWVGASSSVLTGDYTKYGISTSLTTTDYGSVAGESLKNDWGTTIDNAGTWSTLSMSEWSYLVGESTTGRSTSLRKCGVTVCGKTKCLVIAPDNWNLSTHPLQTENSSISTPMTWEQAETAGLVCLPCAGYRWGNAYGAPVGEYYSSTANGSENALALKFTSSSAYTDNDVTRPNGFSVRLVTLAQQHKSLNENNNPIFAA